MTILNDRYKINSLLTSGGFGIIYKGYDINNNINIAIKTEKENKYLEKESKIYDLICESKNNAKKIDFINTNSKFYLIMPLYSYNSDKLLKLNNLYFNEKDILMLAIQILQQLNNIHKNGILHNDVKPENFVYDKISNKFKLIDFGLSDFFLENNKHVPFTKKCPRFGTLRYMSINAHSKFSLSRRDDLISLSYSLIYLLRIKLPWKNIKYTAKKKNSIHKEIKNHKILFHDNINTYNLLSPILCLYNYSSDLKFNSNPDYNFLIKGIYNYLKYKNYSYDGKWSWDAII